MEDYTVIQEVERLLYMYNEYWSTNIAAKQICMM